MGQGVVHPDTSWWSYRASLLSDVISYKRLRVSQASEEARIDAPFAVGYEELAEIAWCSAERLQLSARVGTGALKLKWLQQGESAETEGSFGFVWGGQGKLIIFQVKDTLVGGGFTGGGFERLAAYNRLGGDKQSSRERLTYRFWTVDVGVEQRFSSFRPYGGFLFGQSAWKVNEFFGHKIRFRDRHRSGIYIGCAVSNETFWLLDFELRQLIEQAASVTFALRF
jgi:hypothetical protein